MLTNITNAFLDILTVGYDVVFEYGYRVLLALMAIDLAVFGIGVAAGKANDMGSLVMKVFQIGILMFLFIYWKDLAMTFAESLTGLMAAATGGDPALMTMPSEVLEFGIGEVLVPLEDAAKELQGGFLSSNTISNMHMILMVVFVSAIAMICFLIIAFQLALAQIEFHATLLMSIALLPFGAFKPTEWISQKVFGAVLGHAVKMAMVSLVVGLVVGVFRSYLVPLDMPDGVLRIGFVVELLAALLLSAFLAIQIPALATSLLSGVPNLSAAGMMQNGASMVIMAKGAMSAAAGLGKTAAKASIPGIGAAAMAGGALARAAGSNPGHMGTIGAANLGSAASGAAAKMGGGAANLAKQGSSALGQGVGAAAGAAKQQAATSAAGAIRTGKG